MFNLNVINVKFEQRWNNPQDTLAHPNFGKELKMFDNKGWAGIILTLWKTISFNGLIILNVGNIHAACHISACMK